MMRHLTPYDYITMAWANGKGSTIEMLRVEAEGRLKWRLSRASVVENGGCSLPSPLWGGVGGGADYPNSLTTRVCPSIRAASSVRIRSCGAIEWSFTTDAPSA